MIHKQRGSLVRQTPSGINAAAFSQRAVASTTESSFLVRDVMKQQTNLPSSRSDVLPSSSGSRPFSVWKEGFDPKSARVGFLVDKLVLGQVLFNNNNNNNTYLLQLGCHPVAVVILHVNKT